MMGRLIGEDDGYIAFGKAGLDKNFTLFKIYTKKLRDEKSGEDGQFSMDCTYPLTDL